MSPTSKPDSGKVPVTTAEVVRHYLGPVSDHTIVEILEVGPSEEDLEVASMFASGVGNRVDKLGHTLSGTAAAVYDIISRDELYLTNED